MEKRPPSSPTSSSAPLGKSGAAAAFAKAKTQGKAEKPAVKAAGAVASKPEAKTVSKEEVKASPQGQKAVAASFSEAKPKGVLKKASWPRRLWRALMSDASTGDMLVTDERQALVRRRHILGIIHFQNMVIAGLVVFMLLAVPFFQPFFEHYALSPKKQVARIVNLDAPNMTNAALVSWAATSVTELMTLGFGDFSEVILAKRVRFTQEGWDSFIEAVRREKWREAFLDRQVVLTTAPSDTPVITEQGEEEEHYMWKVEVPIIMTFVTNNNVTRAQKNLISLTIVRVPTSESASGIAIQNWKVGKQQ